MVISLTNRIKVVRPAVSVFPYSNSLFVDDQIRLMIDAGSGGKAYSNIPANSVDMLLLTHNHFDHTNGVSLFKNARIQAGKEEAKGYSNPEVFYSFMGLDRWPELMGKADVEQFAQGLTMPEDIPARSVGFNPVNLQGYIKDGDVFNLGKTTVTAIHTPGHSPGHYAFLIEKEGILFSGDIDLAPHGPWYGSELCNLDDLIQSVEKIKALNPETLVTSHRRVFHNKKDNIPKLLDDYIGIVYEKEEKVLNSLSCPKTVDDMAYQDFIYDSRVDSIYMVFSAKMMLIKHLERLERLGAIRRTEDGHYLKV